MTAFSASASNLLWRLLREKLFGRLLQKPAVLRVNDLERKASASEEKEGEKPLPALPGSKNWLTKLLSDTAKISGAFGQETVARPAPPTTKPRRIYPLNCSKGEQQKSWLF
ncbi:MAG: hypothetical protein WCF57_10455 [Pyrinomonadaceae bacterium]